VRRNDSRSATGVTAGETCRRDRARTGSVPEECLGVSGAGAGGLEVNPRGQGPRGYGSAARRLPAFEARDAGGVTPRKYR